MIYDDSPYGNLERQRARIHAQANNDGRTARVHLTWTTKGIGEVRLDAPRSLNVLFIEEPIVTTGMVVDTDDGIDLQDGHYPRAQAGVYDWQMHAAGFYIGAYLFFVVDTIGPGATVGQEPNYLIHHQIVFEGKAIKQLPGHLLDM